MYVEIPLWLLHRKYYRIYLLHFVCLLPISILLNICQLQLKTTAFTFWYTFRSMNLVRISPSSVKPLITTKNSTNNRIDATRASSSSCVVVYTTHPHSNILKSTGEICWLVLGFSIGSPKIPSLRLSKYLQRNVSQHKIMVPPRTMCWQRVLGYLLFQPTIHLSFSLSISRHSNNKNKEQV